MPAPLPGSTNTQNLANPSLGRVIMFDALSGPKGSPFDRDSANNASTGALSTGIGFNPSAIIAATPRTNPHTVAQAIRDAGFTDNDSPGSGANSTKVYIGGGRSGAAAGGIAPTTPYTSGFALCSAGNGSSRDAGGGVGFVTKLVTAVGNVAVGGEVEAGWVNRAAPLVVGDSVFGVDVSGGGGPATALSLSGPSSGATNSASTDFTVAQNGTGTCDFTPTSSSGSGTFTPSVLHLSGTTPQTFTYTPTTSGARNINGTNTGGLVAPTNIVYTASSAAASALTLSGPSTGLMGAASTDFTVAQNGIGTTDFTPTSDAGTGTFTPSVLHLSGTTAQTFTYTPTSLGARNIGGTNTSSLTGPATVAYNATSGAIPVVTDGPTATWDGAGTETVHVESDIATVMEVRIGANGGPPGVYGAWVSQGVSGTVHDYLLGIPDGVVSGGVYQYQFRLTGTVGGGVYTSGNLSFTATAGGLDTVAFNNFANGPGSVLFGAGNEDINITIPVLVNGMLLVTAYQFGVTPCPQPIFDPAGAAITMSRLSGSAVDVTYGGQPMGMEVFYLQNPTAGAKVIRLTAGGFMSGFAETFENVKQTGIPFGTPVIHSNGAGFTGPLVTDDPITATAQNQVHIYMAGACDPVAGGGTTSDQTMISDLGDITSGFTGFGIAIARGAGSVGMVPQFHNFYQDFPWMIGAVAILPS